MGAPEMTRQEREAAFLKKLKKYGFRGFLALFAFILVMGSYSNVGPGERGVMVTMGKTGELGRGNPLSLDMGRESKEKISLANPSFLKEEQPTDRAAL